MNPPFEREVYGLPYQLSQLDFLDCKICKGKVVVTVEPR